MFNSSCNNTLLVAGGVIIILILMYIYVNNNSEHMIPTVASATPTIISCGIPPGVDPARLSNMHTNQWNERSDNRIDVTPGISTNPTIIDPDDALAGTGSMYEMQWAALTPRNNDVIMPQFMNRAITSSCVPPAVTTPVIISAASTVVPASVPATMLTGVPVTTQVVSPSNATSEYMTDYPTHL